MVCFSRSQTRKKWKTFLIFCRRRAYKSRVDYQVVIDKPVNSTVEERSRVKAKQDRMKGSCRSLQGGRQLLLVGRESFPHLESANSLLGCCKSSLGCPTTPGRGAPHNDWYSFLPRWEVGKLILINLKKIKKCDMDCKVEQIMLVK